MKYGPLIAVIFGFFLIAVYPYYVDNEPTVFILSDDDGDGVPNDKDLCPEEDASEMDVDEDGCLDKKITKKEVDYIEAIAKFNLGQYILFAALSLFGTAIYWEREKIKAVLYEDDDLDFSKLTDEKSSGDIGKDVDYEELGKYGEYNIKNSSYANFNFSFKKLNEEADIGTQILCLAYIVLLFTALGYVGEFSWFNVEGTQNSNTGAERDFEIRHYSDYLEYAIGETDAIDIRYESSRCTPEVDEFYNCDYRQSLFGTVNTLLSISLFLSFFAILLAYRAQKYRIWIASVFSIALVTSMASLLVFTALIDNALISDSHTLDQEQEIAGGCWMSEPVIWGKTECVSLTAQGEYLYQTDISYSPGVSFYLVLICTSIMFIGLFTNISPMISMERTNWYEAIRNNWQVFAIVFFIVFLWRLNVLMSNL